MSLSIAVFRETVLLTSAFNKEMYEHLKFVCAVTLAELFGKEVDEMEWMLSIFPKHYEHPNSETAK